MSAPDTDLQPVRWKATFVGRPVGAIGSFDPYTIEVVAATRNQANLAIYATHEHLRDVVLEVVEADRGEGEWECFGCLARRPSLDKGFNTRCDRCGSYELHLTDEARRG